MAKANVITYEFNRYADTPTMEVSINCGKKAYLSPFRGYRFQVSDTKSGNGLISESMLNTKMHELATLSCGRAILSRLAMDALERANVDRKTMSVKSFKAFIDASIEWLIKNADSIDSHNDVYQAGDRYLGTWRDLT
jgi:hypothetical protein